MSSNEEATHLPKSILVSVVFKVCVLYKAAERNPFQFVPHPEILSPGQTRNTAHIKRKLFLFNELVIQSKVPNKLRITWFKH